MIVLLNAVNLLLKILHVAHCQEENLVLKPYFKP